MQLNDRSSGESARDYAQRIIQENIISMRYEPGMQMSENDLSLQLGVSRTPIREALTNLKNKRIVEVYPHIGCRLALIDYDMVEEARFIRETLETAILPLVCERMTPEGIQALKQNLQLQRLTQNPQMQGVFDLLRLDDEFHHLLFQIANKEATYRIIKDVQIHFDRVRNLALRTLKDLKVIADHEAICAALIRKDVAQAQELMTHHLRRTIIEKETLCREYPQYMTEKSGRA